MPPLYKTKSLYVPLTAIAALLIPVIWIEAGVLGYTNGIWSFPLDDTFIHMAVAKNLAFEHVWGISKYEFQSASSSPLYTVILALSFLIGGLHSIIPLLINLAAGVCFVWVLWQWLEKHGLSAVQQMAVLLLVIFLTPLPLLVISGMEHTLQLLFCFLFVYEFSETFDSPRMPLKVYIYGLLMVTTRYECMSMVAIACLLLLIAKRWKTAVLLGLCSLLGILLFGAIAVSKGSYFMPNSVLLKSSVPPPTLAGWMGFLFGTFWIKLLFVYQDYNILSAQRMLLILPLLYLFYREAILQVPAYGRVLIIMLGAALAHVSFAYYSPYPRYEAYVIGCSAVIICTLVIKYSDTILAGKIKEIEWVSIVLLVILASPLFIRSWNSFGNAKQDCINIYDQQYQMARFVHEFYNKDGIAFNDIGAVSFYSEGPKLDMIGIASLDVLKSKKKGYWSPYFADSLARKINARLAVVYDPWFNPVLLNHWGKVASWTIQNNLIAAFDSVSFYAVDRGDTSALKNNLKAFQPQLPPSVLVRYY